MPPGVIRTHMQPVASPWDTSAGQATGLEHEEAPEMCVPAEQTVNCTEPVQAEGWLACTSDERMYEQCQRLVQSCGYTRQMLKSARLRRGCAPLGGSSVMSASSASDSPWLCPSSCLHSCTSLPMSEHVSHTIVLYTWLMSKLQSWHADRCYIESLVTPHPRCTARCLRSPQACGQFAPVAQLWS